MGSDFQRFLSDLKKLISERVGIIDQAMSNVFSMRIIGNKTHGDLAEVALVQFLNDNLPGYRAKHVGKDLFRAKSNEEDIEITLPSGATVALSLKAYGVGPLQLSTNKDCTMFPFLSELFTRAKPTGGWMQSKADVRAVLLDSVFSDFNKINVLPLIYDERKLQYNIMVFDAARAFEEARSIRLVAGEGKRKHPVFKFLSQDGTYIFEVRYGDQRANALQRGLWTHTAHAAPFFDTVTGWRTYSHNLILVDLVSKLLVATPLLHGRVAKLLTPDQSPEPSAVHTQLLAK